MPQFLAIGEAMIELYHQNDKTLQLGFAGDTLNTSVYLARLAPHTMVGIHYMTVLGCDPYSDQMLAEWQREKIHTDYITRLSHKLPGLYLIRTDNKGERSFYFYRSDSAARELFTEDHAAQMQSVLMNMDYLYLSLITLAILSREKKQRLLALLKLAKEKGAGIIFDTNYRARLWQEKQFACDAVRELMEIVDTALVTFDDEKELFNDATPKDCAARLHEWGAREVVVKCGAEPCFVSYVVQDNFLEYKQVNVPAMVLSASVVDTTAAGDSFNAAYLAARWQNYPPEEAAYYGHQLAGQVIQHQGAIIPVSAMPKLF